jgi:hypothetical protein
MAAIFPKSSGRWLRIGGATCAAMVLAAVVLFIYSSYPTVIDTGYLPAEPVSFSHKLSYTPAILGRQSYASGQPIPWVKIHSLPDYVYFNHQAHLSSGVSCII